MKSFIVIFAIVAPIIALIGAAVDSLLFFSMLLFMDSPYMDTAFVHMADNLGNGSEIACVLSVVAIILFVVTQVFIKKQQSDTLLKYICAGLGLVALVTVAVPLVPVILLFFARG